MVSGRVAVAAVAAVVAVGSAAIMKPGSFDYYYPQASKNSLSVTERAHEAEKLCYEEGERAIGAKGYPAVPYLPCCSGKPPLPMDPSAKSYVEEEHYGLYCGGTGEVVPTEDCYKAGERSVGAPGKPFVDYKPCCDGKAPQDKYGDWGKFCGLPSPYAPEPVVPEEKIPTKCAGDDGYPYVPYVDCGDGYKCAREPKYGWGFFCLPTGKSCYGPGMKAQGAPGYPKIDYMPCCDGQEQVAMYGEWGKFCPGEKKPMYEAPKPDYYKPYGAPADYKPPTAPRGYEAYGATSAPSSTAPTSYGYYGGYSKKGPSTPHPVTTISLVQSLNKILKNEEFACDSTAGGTAVAGDPLPATVVSISRVEIQLPVCAAGFGLSQADANELLEAICAIARQSEPGAVCTIDSVPAAIRMLVSDNETSLSPVSRQGGGSLVILIGWPAPQPPAVFAVSVQAAFGGSRFTVVISVVADDTVTTGAPTTTFIGTTAPPTTTTSVEADDTVTTGAPTTTFIGTTAPPTTTSPLVPAVQAILNDPEFACDSTAGGTATAGQPLPDTVLSISEIDIQLPVCEAGEGLSQADANELLAAICAQAQLEDPNAVCTIVTVADVARMLVSDSESSLSPVARQGGRRGRVFIQIGWSTPTPPAGFSVRIQGAFAGSRFTLVVTVTVEPVVTPVA